ncbi:hypothetical protein [Haladaptatus cibarius]|uniref:hypothetical protein n=1 Tax=Haladaptatus cibarius TaxID=453847 RepID=UPI0006797A83|nr:hypothetical protein [Haladaptatus cibarius]
MTISNRSSLVSFDVDSAVSALQNAAGDSVHLCVEYDTENFNTLYADQMTLDLYDSEREMVDHFEEVLSYVHVDFMEKDLFEEVFRDAGSVRSFATFMDHVILVRVLVGEEGLFFTVDTDSDVTALVETVEEVIE